MVIATYGSLGDSPSASLNTEAKTAEAVDLTLSVTSCPISAVKYIARANSGNRKILAPCLFALLMMLTATFPRFVAKLIYARVALVTYIIATADGVWFLIKALPSATYATPAFCSYARLLPSMCRRDMLD